MNLAAILPFDAPVGTDLSTLTNYGVLGVFAVLLLAFAGKTVQRERDRADRLEAEVLRLNTVIQDKVIPALVSETHAVNEHTALLRELLGSLRPPKPGR